MMSNNHASSDDIPHEKDFSNRNGPNPQSTATGTGQGLNPYDLSPQEERGTALKKIRTAGSISMSPELFEKLYLSPENKIKGDLRKTFGNPTPL